MVSVGEEIVGVEKLDVVILGEGLDFVEIVDGEGGDGEAGGVPGVGSVVVDPIATGGDDFDAGFEGKIADVFDGPVGVLVESVDDGVPGVECHDPVEHFGVIDLDDKAVEDGGVAGLSVVDNLGKFFFDIWLVGVFGVGDDINVGVFKHKIDEFAVI